LLCHAAGDRDRQTGPLPLQQGDPPDLAAQLLFRLLANATGVEQDKSASSSPAASE
jgi:hypothetical protein